MAESAVEQDMMNARPQREHEWLQRLVGEWTFEAVASGEEGEHRSSGRERVRTLGGLWVVGEGEGEMPGGDVGYTMLTLGYDPQRGRFVGTWVGSMMTYLWVYEGHLAEDERVLRLETDGPDFERPGATARYRESIEWVSDDERRFISEVRKPDGSWQPMMTAVYRRA